MRLYIRLWLALFWTLAAYETSASPVLQMPLAGSLLSAADRNISADLFADLEELSRIVDISYCVGTTGIQRPFQCASRCQDFDGFQLVTVRNVCGNAQAWRFLADPNCIDLGDWSLTF